MLASLSSATTIAWARRNGTGAAELADLVADVLEAARGTAAEERVGRAMAQLQPEAEEDEPDSTVIGKMLERTKEIARTRSVTP